MRFSTAAAAAALVAGASASYPYGYNNTMPVYTTKVVTAYTTYCPGPTQITHGSVTYTVTEATTLTITDCPCTVTYPVYTSTVTSCTSEVCSSSSYVPPPVSTSSCSEVSTTSYVAPPPTTAPYTNGTTTVAPYTPVGTGSSTYSQPPATYTGAANQAIAASGAGLAAVFGFVAYIL